MLAELESALPAAAAVVARETAAGPPGDAVVDLGDALGLNGEGLQIGEGDIDFIRLGEILRKGCPQASFIPEIWQGHKNGGEGFWIALERLEGAL